MLKCRIDKPLKCNQIMSKFEALNVEKCHWCHSSLFILLGQKEESLRTQINFYESIFMFSGTGI